MSQTTTEGSHVKQATSRKEIPAGPGPTSPAPGHEGKGWGRQGLSSLREDKKRLLISDSKLTIPFDHETAKLPEKTFDTLDVLAAVMVERPKIEVVVKEHFQV